MAVTDFRPSPDTSASWRIDAPARWATRIMSSRIAASFSTRFCAEADYDEGRAGFAIISTSILVHCHGRRMYIGAGIAHCSSLSPRASLSRIVIRSGTRGDISALASASLRCAKVIPRSSSASIRSSSILTTGSIIATNGPFRTTPRGVECSDTTLGEDVGGGSPVRCSYGLSSPNFS